MKFDDFDKKMRVYETAHDHCVLPGLFIVLRLDGRSFTRLTKEVHAFEAPFDARFRDYMVETARHLMTCGFNVLYAYTESDEISLLLHPDERSFGRKVRKLVSVMAGEASGKFSLLLGDLACFDCRVSMLPSERLVADYFRWRHEDAHRNALNAHCYWARRQRGDSAEAATKALLGVSVAEKNELLFQSGINFNDLPSWQKRGVGLYWEEHEREGRNPITGKKALGTRRRIRADMNLPMRDEYSEFVRALLRAHTGDEATTDD